VEIIGYMAAFLTTASFLPQAIKTIRTKSTKDLSPFMYSGLVLGLVCWLIYGISLKNIPMTLANGITLIFASIILFVILTNRLKKR